MSHAPTKRSDFLLLSCKAGAEEALCQQQKKLLPHLTKAAWRSGVVTFRLGDFDPPDDFFPDLIFNTTCVRSCGQVKGKSILERAEAVLSLLDHSTWDVIHVWSRDQSHQELDDIRDVLSSMYTTNRSNQTAIAQPGDLVMDCCVDSPDRWWMGWHRAAKPPSCWPGGLYPFSLPQEKVSRAWLKLDEVMTTFDIPMRAGQHVIELGAAPGGACQRLLESGLHVVGVDPALVDKCVSTHQNFEQWRMRARDIKLRSLRRFHWVAADMNIDPLSTLEAIERVVKAKGNRVQGVIATLKLPSWNQASELSGWIKQFHTWGFSPYARQLSTGGQEVCVYAKKVH